MRKPFEPLAGQEGYIGVFREEVVLKRDVDAAIAQDKAEYEKAREDAAARQNKLDSQGRYWRYIRDKYKGKARDFKAERDALRAQLAHAEEVLQNLFCSVTSDVTLSESTIRFHATVGSFEFNEARDYFAKKGQA